MLVSFLVAVVATTALSGCNERAEHNKELDGSSSAGIYHSPIEMIIPYDAKEFGRIDCKSLTDRDIPENSAFCYRIPLPEKLKEAYETVAERILLREDKAYSYVGYVGGPVLEKISDGIETIEVNTIGLPPGTDPEAVTTKKCIQVRDALVAFVSRSVWEGLLAKGAVSGEVEISAATQQQTVPQKSIRPANPPPRMEWSKILWMKFTNLFRIYPIYKYSKVDAYKFTSDMEAQKSLAHLLNSDTYKVRAGRSVAVTVCMESVPEEPPAPSGQTQEETEQSIAAPRFTSSIEDGGIIFYTRIPITRRN